MHREGPSARKLTMHLTVSFRETAKKGKIYPVGPKKRFPIAVTLSLYKTPSLLWTLHPRLRTTSTYIWTLVQLPLSPFHCLFFFPLALLFTSGLYIIFVTDTDECTRKKHNCHVQATCNNTVGGFTCTCKDGYWGEGITCKGMLVKCIES